MSSREVGKVKFTSGETSWYGPNGQVVAIPNEETDDMQPDE